MGPVSYSTHTQQTHTSLHCISLTASNSHIYIVVECGFLLFLDLFCQLCCQEKIARALSNKVLTQSLFCFYSTNFSLSQYRENYTEWPELIISQ